MDVFDTLLLRTTKPEFDRFSEISIRQAKLFGEMGYPVPHPRDLYLLRREAARVAYRTRTPLHGAREAHWWEIFELVVAMLGVPQDTDLLSGCLAEELTYEAQQLRWNVRLGKLLDRGAARGMHIFCLSDMYFPAGAIQDLIDRVAGRKTGFRVYSSADFGYGKRSGQLFRKLAEDTGLRLPEIIHLGDNYHSDYLAPSSIGVQASHLPRSVPWRVLHKARSLITHLKYSSL